MSLKAELRSRVFQPDAVRLPLAAADALFRLFDLEETATLAEQGFSLANTRIPRAAGLSKALQDHFLLLAEK